MNKRDRLELITRNTYIPPRTLSKVAIESIPFPYNYDVINAIINSDDKYSYPSRAFENRTGNLIVFSEMDWGTPITMINEREGPTLPRVMTTDITDASFLHELCAIDDYTPESLGDFISKHGWFFFPYYESQRRFLAFRYHDDTKDNSAFLAYKYAYPDCIAENFVSLPFKLVGKKDADLQITLLNASTSVMKLYNNQLPLKSIRRNYYEQPSVDEVSTAVILSEYARRYLLKSKTASRGGVISYYETYRVIIALQQAIKTAEECSIAAENPDILRKGIQLEKVKSKSSNIGKYAYVDRVLDSKELTNLQKSNAINNIWQNEFQEAILFLSLCATSTGPGAMPVSVKRHHADPKAPFGELDENHKPSRYAEINYEYPFYFDNKFAEGSYSAAVSAQFLDTLRSEQEWKLCKNRECGNYFKAKYNPDKTSKRIRQGDYCCEKCGQIARNARNNAEAKIIKIAKRNLTKKEKGFETIEKACKQVEKELLPYYADDDIKRLPSARKRWRQKLEK